MSEKVKETPQAPEKRKPGRPKKDPDIYRAKTILEQEFLVRFRNLSHYGQMRIAGAIEVYTEEEKITLAKVISMEKYKRLKGIE